MAANHKIGAALLAFAIIMLMPVDAAFAAAPTISANAETTQTVRTVLVLTLMAFIPALMICTTSFVRIVVVLSMVRHGLGMPETPPNSVLLSLALFLTLLSTGPALQAVSERGVQPFLDGRISVDQAMERSAEPLRSFMLKQVRDSDLKTIYGIARKPLPAKPADVSMVQLVPAFMLNELRVAFTIGFVILLPFLLIDLIVSAVLLSLGMLMVPPATISLPLKILMFVVIDGWGLLVTGVIGSFR
jgi:flagellar biosynthesis protein FliP